MSTNYYVKPPLNCPFAATRFCPKNDRHIGKSYAAGKREDGTGIGGWIYAMSPDEIRRIRWPFKVEDEYHRITPARTFKRRLKKYGKKDYTGIHGDWS